VTTDNAHAACEGEVAFIYVKPVDVGGVLSEIGDAIKGARRSSSWTGR